MFPQECPGVQLFDTIFTPEQKRPIQLREVQTSGMLPKTDGIDPGLLGILQQGWKSQSNILDALILCKIRDTLWLWLTVRHGIDGPNRNRWFTY